MGLDHYLVGKRLISQYMNDEAAAHNAARAAVLALTPDLPLAEDAYITYEVELYRWRKSYLIHDWWIEATGFSETAACVDPQLIVKFNDWLTPLVMSGRSTKLAKQALATVGTSGGWSTDQVVDTWFWSELEHTAGVFGKLAEQIAADDTCKALRGWDFYYDGSW